MRSSSTSKPHPKTEIKTPQIQARQIQAIDALFEQAGLVRSLRGKAAGVTLRMRFERAAGLPPVARRVADVADRGEQEVGLLLVVGQCSQERQGERIGGHPARQRRVERRAAVGLAFGEPQVADDDAVGHPGSAPLASLVPPDMAVRNQALGDAQK